MYSLYLFNYSTQRAYVNKNTKIDKNINLWYNGNIWQKIQISTKFTNRSVAGWVTSIKFAMPPKRKPKWLPVSPNTTTISQKDSVSINANTATIGTSAQTSHRFPVFGAFGIVKFPSPLLSIFTFMLRPRLVSFSGIKVTIFSVVKSKFSSTTLLPSVTPRI